MEMPSASPAGTHPFMISLVKSCPDKSEVNGRFGRVPRCCQVETGPTPGARIAVPIALNSRPPAGNAPMVSRTPTTPCPPSSLHSAVIRSRALCRASYMAWTRGANEPQPAREETCVLVRAGMTWP